MFVERVALGGLVLKHGGIGLPCLALVYPQQAAFGLQFFVHIGNVNIGLAIACYIADGGVHAFVGVAPDAADKCAAYGLEAFALAVDVKLVWAKVVGDV